MSGTRISLQAGVVATVCLLLVASILQGALAFTSTTRSAQQVTSLEQQGLEPVVGLSLLSQDLDQERALLESDRASLTSSRAAAVVAELQSLDRSITSSARSTLSPSVLPAWNAAWVGFVHERLPYIANLQGRDPQPMRANTRGRLSYRLDVVLDVVQSAAGVELNNGERLYAQSLASDRQALRLVVLSLLASLALGLLLAFRITRRLRRGLGDLSVTASLVAGGTVTARADERGHDEIAKVATAINHMKDALLSAELRAGTDALTEIPNHRAIIAMLDQELERAFRYGRRCAVLFIDLDHFKALNDGYGHAVGDALLCAFTQIVRTSLRGVDSLGRWGGEEFVALLPELGRQEAQVAAERVRMAVAAHTFALAGGVRLTCSIGVAAYPEDAEDRAALLSAADYAMYAAKHLGRNQTRTAVELAVAALRQGTAGAGSREETFLVGTVEALAALVDVRDHYTGQHTIEVATLCRLLTLALGLDASQTRMIEHAARLHDVGKVAIPDAILQKPGRLSEEEWLLMRTHSSVGADIVGRVPALQSIVPLIRGHHERWDGTGYPDGLADTAIPVGARIIAVADAFCAMVSDRPYREARTRGWALAELQRASATQFDPAVVDALERVLAATPSLAARTQAS